MVPVAADIPSEIRSTLDMHNRSVSMGENFVLTENFAFKL